MAQTVKVKDIGLRGVTVSGWPALYRPRAEYVGQYCGLSGCTYEPLEAREERP